MKWTDADDEYLIANYATTDNAILAEHLGRTPAAIQVHANRILKLKNGVKFTNAHWSKAEIKYLEENYRKKNICEMVAELGRSTSAVNQKLDKLGFTKKRLIKDRGFIGGKHYRKCLSPTDADRMFTFLCMTYVVGKRNRKRLNVKPEIDLKEMAEAFRVAGV